MVERIKALFYEKKYFTVKLVVLCFVFFGVWVYGSIIKNDVYVAGSLWQLYSACVDLCKSVFGEWWTHGLGLIQNVVAAVVITLISSRIKKLFGYGLRMDVLNTVILAFPYFYWSALVLLTNYIANDTLIQSSFYLYLFFLLGGLFEKDDKSYVYAAIMVVLMIWFKGHFFFFFLPLFVCMLISYSGRYMEMLRRNVLPFVVCFVVLWGGSAFLRRFTTRMQLRMVCLQS